MVYIMLADETCVLTQKELSCSSVSLDVWHMGMLIGQNTTTSAVACLESYCCSCGTRAHLQLPLSSLTWGLLVSVSPH